MFTLSMYKASYNKYLKISFFYFCVKLVVRKIHMSTAIKAFYVLASGDIFGLPLLLGLVGL
jgi:hypothetical protein